MIDSCFVFDPRTYLKIYSVFQLQMVGLSWLCFSLLCEEIHLPLCPLFSLNILCFYFMHLNVYIQLAKVYNCLTLITVCYLEPDTIIQFALLKRSALSCTLPAVGFASPVFLLFVCA